MCVLFRKGSAAAKSHRKRDSILGPVDAPCYRPSVNRYIRVRLVKLQGATGLMHKPKKAFNTFASPPGSPRRRPVSAISTVHKDLSRSVRDQSCREYTRLLDEFSDVVVLCPAVPEMQFLSVRRKRSLHKWPATFPAKTEKVPWESTSNYQGFHGRPKPSHQGLVRGKLFSYAALVLLALRNVRVQKVLLLKNLPRPALCFMGLKVAPCTMLHTRDTPISFTAATPEPRRTHEAHRERESL